MTPKQRKAKTAYERERRRLHRLHRFENAARAMGFTLVGGIDDVGRGPLAGPVVAACVVASGPLFIKGLNDSKQVRPDRRVAIAEIVTEDELSPEYVIPSVFDVRVVDAVAKAVASAALEDGVARRTPAKLEGEGLDAIDRVS